MPGLNGRVSDWTTGLGLGGGSSITGMYYGRVSHAVYSQWQTVSNSTNWSLNNILNTFIAIETYQGLTITPNARGQSGKVNILQTPTVAPLTLTTILPACQAAF